MYISVLPLAISIRRTNVYEEHSLGIYVAPESAEARDEGTYIKAHIRRQLEFDLWYVFLGLFLICVAEGGRIADASDYVCIFLSRATLLLDTLSNGQRVGIHGV